MFPDDMARMQLQWLSQRWAALTCGRTMWWALQHHYLMLVARYRTHVLKQRLYAEQAMLAQDDVDTIEALYARPAYGEAWQPTLYEKIFGIEEES